MRSLLIHIDFAHLAVAAMLIVATWTDASAQVRAPLYVSPEASELPRGPGIAADWTANSPMDQRDDVIFADDFESGELGAAWDEIRNDANEVLALVPGPSGDAPTERDSAPAIGNRSLRVVATLGKNTGGGLTKWFKSADRLFIRFYTRFDPNCDYVHHFCTLRANKGLVGADRWSGFGGAGELPAGDSRFSTALEPWGDWGRRPPPGRWNLYSYWHEMNVSPDGRYWGNSFQPPSQPDIQRGEWICAEMMLKHNTPGRTDGEQAFWIDGELRGHWREFNWRTSQQLQANAFTLESYVTDRWTEQRENVIHFDNVVIARSYIGPVPAVNNDE